LAVLQSLTADRALDVKRDVRYVGREGSIEERLAAAEGIPFAPIRVGGLRRLALWTLAPNLILLLRAVSSCRQIINNFKPQVVLATGGYVSAPAIWAAAQTETPVVIYLPDLEPGWAVRALSRWAQCVAVSFEEVKAFFPSGKTVITGYPVRADFYRATKRESRLRLGLEREGRVITVFGGSQGAHSINEAVRENLHELLNVAQVIHISGREDEPMLQGHRAVLSEREYPRYHLYGYMDEEMPIALAAADVVVARAGAATLGEFPALGVPSILVPYPFAGRHQARNAAFLVSRGASIEVDDDRLAMELVPTVTALLADHARLEGMAAAARALAHPDAAKNIADLLAQVVM
jgi:UDP-N-acetylglucosamine--N-acetylmuramyl-(pentapeptide) pyrophosphoryl-undecaprenol N-acetylglucosamine transferase